MKKKDIKLWLLLLLVFFLLRIMPPKEECLSPNEGGKIAVVKSAVNINRRLKLTVNTSGGGGGGSGGGGGGGVSAVVSNAATVTKKAEQVITNIAGAFDDFTSGTTTLAGINAASNRGFPFGTSGANTNTLAGIMAASAQPTVTINVNAPSIIDEEGFSRAINNAQNNSFFRGTGGATNLVGI